MTRSNMQQKAGSVVVIPVTGAIKAVVARIERRRKNGRRGDLTNGQADALVRIAVSGDEFLAPVTTRAVRGSKEREARTVVRRKGSGRVEEVLIGSRGRITVRPMAGSRSAGSHSGGRRRAVPSRAHRRRQLNRRTPKELTPGAGLSPLEILERRLAGGAEEGN